MFNTLKPAEPLQGQSLFLTAKSQEFLVLIQLTLERWDANSALEPLNNFEPRNPKMVATFIFYKFALTFYRK